MTRLLSIAVALFRARRHAQLDWVPLVWAACIFYSLLEFSWALHWLGSLIEKWTFPLFLVLFCLDLILFVAASLILPHAELEAGQSLSISFDLDGRWALAFLAGYDLLATVANWYFWKAPLFTLRYIINGMLAGLAIAYLCSSSRNSKCTVTMFYALIEFGTIFLVG